MNLVEAKRELENLRKQRKAIRAALDDPLTVHRVGTDNWDRWKSRQGRLLNRIEQDIGKIKRQVRALERAQVETRQLRLEERRKRLESQSDPSLRLLADAFKLLIELRDEGVEMDEDEVSLIDHIGVHLKEVLKMSNGKGVELCKD